MDGRIVPNSQMLVSGDGPTTSGETWQSQLSEDVLIDVRYGSGLGAMAGPLPDAWGGRRRW